jgi:tetratricopeptide (TPR) repeat protein
MGMLNRRRGFDREALQNFDTAKRFEKNHADAILGMAQLVLDQPDPSGGYISQAKALKDLIDAQPPASPRQQAMAHVLKALLMSRVASDIPLYTDAEFQKNLATAAGVSKDNKDKNKKDVEAEEAQGFNMDSKNSELFLIRGKRLYFEKNIDGAAAEIRKAIALSPTRVHLHVELAKVLAAKEGGENELEQALRKSLAVFPDNPKLATMLGQVLYKEKRADDAVVTLEKAVKAAKENAGRVRMPDAFYVLGRIFRDKKDLQKAIDAFEACQAQAFGDALLASQCNDEMAQIYEEKKDTGAARARYEKATLSPDNPAAFCRFVHFMQKGGDAKDKDEIKRLAKTYAENAPRGECFAEMKGLAQ